MAFYNIETLNPGGVIIQDMALRETQFSLFKMAWNFALSLKINQDYKPVILT